QSVIVGSECGRIAHFTASFRFKSQCVQNFTIKRGFYRERELIVKRIESEYWVDYSRTDHRIPHSVIHKLLRDMHLYPVTEAVRRFFWCYGESICRIFTDI